MDSHITDSPLGKRNPTAQKLPINHAVGSIGKNLNGNGGGGSDLNTAFESPLTTKVRPTSEIFLQNSYRNSAMEDSMDKAAEQWLADLETYQLTLQQMAEVRLDRNFKDELSAIEQWFQVLSEAERTAALFALLQQTTPIQIRFFITVLQKLANKDPLSAALSPTNPERDLLQNQLNEAILRQQQRDSQLSPGKPGNGLLQPDQLLGRPSGMGPGAAQPGNYNGSPASTFMTPSKDMYAAAAAAAVSNNSGSLLNSFPKQMAPPVTPWAQEINRPKSATDASSSASSLRNQVPLVEGSPPPHYNGLKTSSPSTGPSLSTITSLNQPLSAARRAKQSMHRQNRSLSHMDDNIHSPGYAFGSGPNLAAPGTPAASGLVGHGTGQSYLPDGHLSWASVTNTPISSTGTPRDKINLEILSTTAMKMAALSTVNGRVQLDSDLKKFRRHGGVMTDEDQKYIEKEFMSMASASNNNNGNGSVTGTPSSGGGMNWAQYSNGAPGSMTKSPEYKNSNISRQRYSMGAIPISLNGGLDETPSRKTPGSAKHGQTASIGGGITSNSGTPSKKETNYLDPRLLEDVAAWLRVLRLHKYTDNLADLTWRQLVDLDEKQLEDRGVNALGARRKMLKVFEQIKDAEKNGELDIKTDD